MALVSSTFTVTVIARVNPHADCVDLAVRSDWSHDFISLDDAAVCDLELVILLETLNDSSARYGARWDGLTVHHAEIRFH